IYVTASEWEGFNMPLVEAQYFGKPVVALDVAAHPEVVQNGETGVLVPNVDGFADVIRRLADDPAMRRRMGVRAREWATRFSWATAVDHYDRLIAEFVEETRWRR